VSEEVVSRAKFRCVSMKVGSADGSGPKGYEFQAMYDTSTPENKRYAKYTPYGKLEITVDNEAVNFVPGKNYYLDFIEAED
jgi:hypothetical protein